MAKIAFTAGRVTGLKCPAGKAQAFLWDTAAPGLGLRVTPAGKPSYIFQSEYQGKTMRLTIGSPDAWSIPQAQEKARELQRQLDEGRDPRTVKAEKTATDVAKRDAERQSGMTFGEVWAEYLEERRPHWGTRHHADQALLVKAGGAKIRGGIKGGGLTIPGVLHCFVPLRLNEITTDVVEAWSVKEAKTRPTQARLAWRCMKAFFTWCSESKDYKHLAPTNPAKTKKAREALGSPNVKTDVLQREQLAVWFSVVRQIGNPAISAYLQCLLLVGARPGEVISIKWQDVNTQWKGIAIRDKVEGEREIPLTPYVAHLLAALPRRMMRDKKTGKEVPNPWVFSSPTSKAGRLSEPTYPHTRACKAAGLEGLTLHGLRRSFKSLTEWLEVPVGVVAQIQGHKPSATAEKHYTVRPLELLRVHHEKIEAWMLEQAGVKFDAAAVPGKLRVVAG